MLLVQVRARLNRQEGQALIEYALIISLIALFLVGSLTFVGGKMAGVFTTVGSALH